MHIKNLHVIATKRYLRQTSTTTSYLSGNLCCKLVKIISTAGYNTSAQDKNTPHDIMTLTVSETLQLIFKIRIERVLGNPNVRKLIICTQAYHSSWGRSRVIDPDNSEPEKCQHPKKPMITAMIATVTMPMLRTPNDPSIFWGSLI